MNPEFWRHIFDAIEDPAFLHDKQFRVLLANRAYCREAGVTEKEAQGKPYWEVFPPGSGPLPGCKDAMDRKGHGGSQEEVSVGAKLFLSKSYTARDDQGKSLHALHILSDITDRKRDEAALRENQVRFDFALRSASMGVWHWDIIENRRYFDDQVCRLLGINPTTFTGAAEEFFGALHPDDRETIKASLARTMEQDVPYEREFRAVWPDGSVHDITSRGRLVRDDKGRPAKISGIAWDVSARKQSELTLQRVNRAFHTLSACNGALMRAGNESELLDSICRLIVETGGYRMAWVGFPEQGADKCIRPVASAGFEAGYLESLNLTWADEECGRDPTGIAIRTGNPSQSNDIYSDLRFTPWQEEALRLGYQSLIALPLKENGQVLGALTIYACEPAVFQEDVLALLTELVNDLAFGISNLRSRADRLNILDKLDHSLDHAVSAIAATLEMRDPYTAGHQRRVAKLAAAIATEMGFSDNQVQGLHIAGVVHDIGKIRVPAEILSNPGKLTVAEFEIIKTHSEAGWDILKGIDFPWPVAEMVYQHHEKLDGSGYPRGLKSEEILLETRILTVADVVEAMTSHRPYRPGFGVFQALQEMSRNKGKLYDVAVVEACLRLFMEKNYEF